MARVRHGAGPRGCGAPATHRLGARPCPREQNIRTATAERAPVGDGNSHRARKDKESAHEDEPVAHRVRRGRRPRAADGLRGRPGPQAEVRGREVLRHLEGRQERLPDGELLLRRHQQARPAGRRLDLHAGGRVREGGRRQHAAEESLMTTMAPTMTTTVPETGVRGRLAHAVALAGRFPLSVLQLLFRLAVASVFLKAGLNKIASWELTVQLFADEYKVPVLSPDLAARLASTFEIGCSMLLILGLGTRLATLLLLGMIVVIQTTVYPNAYAEHLTWGSILLFLLTRGGGPWSLDRVLGLEPADSGPC